MRGRLLNALGCCVVLLSLQCSSSPAVPTPVVHFILPAGFNGPFVIAASDRQPPGPFAKSSRREYRIPRDGVLVVQDDSVLYTWHRLMVSTADGTISRASPDLVTGGIKESALIFLEKDTGQDGKWRTHVFYFGDPAGQDDVEKLNVINSILGEKE